MYVLSLAAALKEVENEQAEAEVRRTSIHPILTHAESCMNERPLLFNILQGRRDQAELCEPRQELYEPSTRRSRAELEQRLRQAVRVVGVSEVLRLMSFVLLHERTRYGLEHNG